MNKKTLLFILTWMFLTGIIIESQAQYIPRDKREKKTTTNTEKQDTTSTTTSTNKKQKTRTELSEFSFLERLTYGGNFGINFGNNSGVEQFFLDISPTVGYIVTEQLVTGVGATYIYNSVNIPLVANGMLEIRQNIYGARGFVQYMVQEPFYLWGEIEGINGNFYNIQTDTRNRDWIISPLIGGGYRSSFGGKAGLNFTVLYNLNFDDSLAFYGSPWIIRSGFTF